ncbi:MAG: serine/threonine-protein kinase, partial [Myxococcota bacterium]
MQTVTLTPSEAEEPLAETTPVLAERAQRLGRYQLCMELASGGMGKVFLARAEGPNGFEKFVALKRIHAHLAEQKDFVDMFLDEARLTSRIDHPNVCSVLDFGEASGNYFIAMEYLVGETLARVIRESVRADPDDPRRIRYAAHIVAQACEGLHAAHELRDSDGALLHVVHRDVSPHNIFVTHDGGVRVVDFGIARAADQTHRTVTGTVKGKFAYMSPEQASGDSTDRRADIWSLGVVLWEMLAGRRLFHNRSDSATVLAVVNAEIHPPSRYAPDVSPALDAVALRALTRSREERWPTAREMGRALQAALAELRQPAGMIEIGEWMEELFPGSGERKRQLQAEARRLPVAVAASASTPPAQSAAASPSVVAQPPSRARLILGPLLGVLLGVAGLWIFLRTTETQDAARETPRETLEPSEARAAPIATVAPPEVAAPEVAAPEVAAPEAAAPEAAAPEVAAPVSTEVAEAEMAGSAMTMRETMRARTMRRRPQMTEAASAGEGRVNVIVRGGYADVWVA